MQGLNPLTMQCTYSTPCGWCTKWDKKCDKKIGCEKPQRGLRATTNVLDETNKPCSECSKAGWHMPECHECDVWNDFKYFERAKENK